MHIVRLDLQYFDQVPALLVWFEFFLDFLWFFIFYCGFIGLHASLPCRSLSLMYFLHQYFTSNIFSIRLSVINYFLHQYFTSNIFSVYQFLHQIYFQFFFILCLECQATLFINAVGLCSLVLIEVIRLYFYFFIFFIPECHLILLSVM